MEMVLIFLKLFLDELGIPSKIDTFDRRKTIQKAVYLGQLTGVDLSYRFGWYLKGPYSPSLAEDYYHLADELEIGDEDYKEYQLKKSLSTKLKEVRPLLKKPKEFKLKKVDWLELVASYHYLRRVRKLSDEAADEVLQRGKPHLYKYKDLAQQKLKKISEEIPLK